MINVRQCSEPIKGKCGEDRLEVKGHSDKSVTLLQTQVWYCPLHYACYFIVVPNNKQYRTL